MEFRVGVPVMGSAIMDAATERGDVGVLISANSLWDNDRREFRLPSERRLKTGAVAGFDGASLSRCDVALDSAGYVAMKLYGGVYPWTVEQYVRLGADSAQAGHAMGNYGWAWYSAMDLCCEPEIAGSPAIVRERVLGTAQLLAEMYDVIDYWRDDDHGEGAWWFRDPMPILQGWRPDDYVQSVQVTAEVMRLHDREWPDLVGVGSVCRRQLRGPNGLQAVLGAIGRALPPHVKLHLFGVKGDALRELASNPRIASVDSCAWDFAARVKARNLGVSKTNEFRLGVMDDWLATQFDAMKPSPQMSLFAAEDSHG